jgi:hypothetical protein
MERQNVYSMGILGLPARSTPVVMACKPPKVITKIKVIRLPVSKPKPVTPTVPEKPGIKPVPTETGRPPWSGSGAGGSTGGRSTGGGQSEGGSTGGGTTSGGTTGGGQNEGGSTGSDGL